MTTLEKLYAEAQRYGNDAAFVANVIATGHSSPTKKMHGLVSLLRQGSTVRVAQFSIDRLIVDDKATDWKELETWSKIGKPMDAISQMRRLLNPNA